MTLASDPPRATIRVDPAVAEAAVWRVISSRAARSPELVASHAARVGPIYELDDPGARDAAFARSAVIEFGELDLAEPLRQALAERPALGSRARVLLIGQARGPHDEGVTCEPGGEHLGFRVEVRRFAEADDLLGWARHALGHAEDTMDPGFWFQPGWDGDGVGASIRSAAQARLHRLWDISVDGRLAAAGWAGRATRERHRARLAADLPGASNEAIDAAFATLWDGPRPDFTSLRAWAERPVTLVTGGGPATVGLPRSDRCPLCRFPSDDVVAPTPSVAARVGVDYPWWRPEHGLCGRCSDRYRLSARLGGA